MGAAVPLLANLGLLGGPQVVQGGVSLTLQCEDKGDHSSGAALGCGSRAPRDNDERRLACCKIHQAGAAKRDNPPYKGWQHYATKQGHKEGNAEGPREGQQQQQEQRAWCQPDAAALPPSRQACCPLPAWLLAGRQARGPTLERSWPQRAKVEKEPE
jgi:hypothetical protein